MQKFQNFICLCAGRSAQLLNLSELARDAGISQPTAKAWLSILESSYIVFQLPPYYENFRKRIIKTPKLYFYDVGLAAYLLGLRTVNDLNSTYTGKLFEILVEADLYKKNHHLYQLRDYWFWRDSHGHEVDLLTIQQGKMVIVEVKSTKTILPFWKTIRVILKSV